VEATRHETSHLLLLAALSASCRLSGPDGLSLDGPALAGPSEFALSLAATASPDVITHDGRSQSLLTVTARGPNGQPVSGVSLRLAIFVGPTSVDYGTLSSKSISTDHAGQAFAMYTAPAPPPPTVTSDTTVDIEIVPEGRDHGNMTSRRVRIRLARGGVILPPNPDVTASFFFSPSQPQEDAPVQFDASGSTGANLTYAWSFGDGTSGSGVVTAHQYSVAGGYTVTLKVTDDRGTSANTSHTVTVSGAADPIANFSISPSDPALGDTVFVDGSLSTTPVGSGRTIVSYEWDFGDGSPIVTGIRQSHVYEAPRTYTITLNVRDTTGRRGTASKTVQVK
jgi:PKD repeat protein